MTSQSVYINQLPKPKTVKGAHQFNLTDSMSLKFIIERLWGQQI